jgi:hypothetical protein
MSKDEWYSKLNLWAHEDSRLERMPLVYLRALAEHIANAQAVEQLRAADSPRVCSSCHRPIILSCSCDSAEPETASR